MEIEVTSEMLRAWKETPDFAPALRAVVAASPLVAELEQARERIRELEANRAEGMEWIELLTEELRDARAHVVALLNAMMEWGRKGNGVPVCGVIGSAFDAADKWLLRLGARGAPAALPEPVGERVTDVSTLRVGDRVSFLGGDPGRLYTGTVSRAADGYAYVTCDGGLPGRTWCVQATDNLRSWGYRDLRLISRAPSTESTLPPVDAPQYVTRTELAGHLEQLAMHAGGDMRRDFLAVIARLKGWKDV